MPKMINREMLAGFTGEVMSYLPVIHKSFETLNADPARVDVLADAHRLVHSIKGAASMLGLSALGHIAFLEEEAIEEVASGQLQWNRDTAAVLLRVLSLVETYLRDLGAGSVHEKPILTEAVKSLRRLRGQPEAEDDAEIELLLGTDGDPVLDGASTAPIAAAPSPGKSPRPRTSAVPKTQIDDYTRVPADLLDTFRAEAEEILQGVGESLHGLGQRGFDKQALLDIRRSAHTLKGAAGSVGLHALSALAHRMEDLLDEINEGTTPYSDTIHSLLLATFDCLGDMAEGQNLADLGQRTESLYARYARLLEAQPAPAASAAPALPAGAAPDRTGVPAELMESFRAEAEDHLLRVSEGLRALESTPDDKAVVLEIRRTIHTIKGAANMIGMHSMSNLAHEMEDVLDGLYEDKTLLSPEILATLYSAVDTVGDLAAGDHKAEALERCTELLSSLRAIVPEHPQPAPLEPLEPEAAIDIPQPVESPQSGQAGRRPSQYVRVPIERLDELVRLVSELLVNRSTFEQHLSAYSRDVEELTRSTGRLKRIAARLDSDFEVSPLRSGVGQLAMRAVFTGANDSGRSDFDALEFDRYTDLHLVSRDLAETSSDISSASGELAHRITDYDSHLVRLGRLTSEVQDKLMRMRMVPLLTLTTRLRRTVRVTSERRQKPVDLVIEGENVELDKTVLEEIAAPLEHLLRNAVDHGIESQATRQVLGKPARGRIKLRAYHEGTRVVLEVSDDGGGMEPDLLREAAVRAGLYSEAEAAQLPLSALHNLIFQPGFSTARTVSETSGRGVGMDIVKSTINRMKGTTSIDTEPGLGTKFIIRLPMTLAIMRVLLVRANGETLAVPLNLITQILRVEPEQIERIGQQSVVRVAGKVVPAVWLGEALQFPRPVDPGLRRLPVLITSLGDRQLALIIDHLVEAREVVVKNMGTLLRRVDGVIGATLMGDGSVVLIVNPSDLAPASVEDSSAPARVATASQPSHGSRVYDVLIVDDSVSVRRVLSSLMKNTGWTPLTARDGVEAMEILDRAVKKPDVVLLDIEMPRMDGYEMLTLLRANSAYRRLPVIMLTSRAGEKHRRKAFELGATDYLVKPYEEETLLTVIRRVVRESREALVQ